MVVRCKNVIFTETPEDKKYIKPKEHEIWIEIFTFPNKRIRIFYVIDMQ